MNGFGQGSGKQPDNDEVAKGTASATETSRQEHGRKRPLYKQISMGLSRSVRIK